MVFRRLPHRPEDALVLLGHDGAREHPLSLPLLRTLIADLFPAFETHGLRPGQTVLLVTAADNRELFPAVTMFALASWGVRVLLPLYTDTADLELWCQRAEVAAILTAASELPEDPHPVLGPVHDTARRLGVPVFDLHEDLGLRHRLEATEPDPGVLQRPAVVDALARVTSQTDALIVTTSGSSGASKLVVYPHGAYPRQCASWQAAGLYDPSRLGGRGFTPLFAHTIGVRALMNGLWTGVPTCLVDTESLKTDPELVVRQLSWMQPEHLTGGPALFRLLLGLLAQVPEVAGAIAGNLRCLVSIGARFDPATADELEAVVGLRPHNAFGTTETQMAFTTLLGDDSTADTDRPLGAPLPGVEVELTPVDEQAGTYRMALRASFGMDRYLTEGVRLRPDGFFDTGDLVERGEDGILRFLGRDRADQIDDGFGVKVPLTPLWARYAAELEGTAHVELFAVRGAPGMAALVYLSRDDLPEGRVTDAPTLAATAEAFAARTRALEASLQPFEFRHHVITRLVLVNSPVLRTTKGTVSRHRNLERERETIAALTDPTVTHAAVLDIRPGLG